MNKKNMNNDLLNEEDKQYDYDQFLREMEDIYPDLDEQNIDYYYKSTLPVHVEENEAAIREVIDLLSNKLWKKTKKSFSQKDGYYDVRNLYTGPEHSSEVIGAYVTVGLYDTLGQIMWPDGSVHIYDSGLEETRWVPRDEIKLFDLEHKELISRIILDCLDRADSLLSKRTGSDEYIRLRFTKGEENEDVVLFRDGAVYGNAEMIDTEFVDLLAGELKRMNEAA